MPEETLRETLERRIVTGEASTNTWNAGGKASPNTWDASGVYVPQDPKASTTAVKFDQGKLDWSLIPIDSVEEILKVLEFGKVKYDSWNWAKGEGFKYSRVFNSTIRHLFAWFRGEDKDPESGLSHLAHAGCNILFLLYFVKHKNRYTNNDDRQQ